MVEVDEIANEACLIVNGYAFVKYNDLFRVINLNKLDKISVVSLGGEVIETTMDDIEIDIVKDYFERNRDNMEE